LSFAERKLGLERILVGAGTNSQNKILEVLDSVKGSYTELVLRLGRIPPRTMILYNETASALFSRDDSISTERELLITNTRLLHSLEEPSEQRPPRPRTLVEFVELVCGKLGITGDSCQRIITAANIHDLARAHHEADGKDRSRQARKQSDILSKQHFSNAVIDILKAMYIDLSEREDEAIPINVQGGNIITSADLLHDAFADLRRLSTEQSQMIAATLREHVGQLFLSEVVEAVLAALTDLSNAERENMTGGRVLLYSNSTDAARQIELRLKNEAFDIVTITSLSKLSEAIGENPVEALVVVSNEQTAAVTKLVKHVEAHGIDISQTPAFIVCRSELTSQLTGLLDEGVHDIVGLGTSYDQLVIKLERAIEQVRERTSRSGLVNGKGTTGHLSDMSLVDILQALGPGRKTARISVTQEDNGKQELVIYLDKGEIAHASLGQLGCPEAIYEALKWTDGFWRIEPITAEELPSPNNDLPNDAILMEGCRLMDESSRIASA
jgi:hypothetical protein